MGTFLNKPWVQGLFMFSEKIGNANLYFTEPKFRPDKHHLCTGSRSSESSRKEGETLQRSRRTSPAVGSYLQPWEGSGICVVNYNFFAWVLSNIHSVHLWAWRVFRTSCIFYLSHCHVLQNCTCEILLARRLRACLLMRSLFQTFGH